MTGFNDSLHFSSTALIANKIRTLLMLLAMAIGSAAVVSLTSLGESARLYISHQFSSLGTNLLIVLPGRSETKGGLPPLLGETPRDLTLNDALSLKRSPSIQSIAPIIVGSAPVSHQQREREVLVLGSTSELLPIRQLEMGLGHFLPASESGRNAALCVLGYKLKQELFGNQTAVGQWIRISDRRFRIIGVLKNKDSSLGMDLTDTAIVPVESAQSLFNTESLFRILVQTKNRLVLDKATRAITDIIRERHDGEDDITIIAQDALLSTFDRILSTLTYAVGGIAAISIAVAGVLIMNVMLIAVSQRTAEIGVLKALGSPPRQILKLFLLEAIILSLCGAISGMIISFIIIWLLRIVLPDFPIETPLWSPLAATAISLAAGLLFGTLPARRAAALDPVRALSRR